jgi:hypothetical protein
MRRGSSRGRAGLRTAATTLALAMGMATVPVAARGAALPLPSSLLAPKKKAKDGLTPEQAAEKRSPVQSQGRQMVAAGELTAATILFDNAAQSEGDPVLFLDAGDTWLALASEDRDLAAAETAKQRAQVAQDILYFHLDSSSDPDYRQVANEEVSGLLARAGLLIDKADETIAEIQAEADSVVTPEAAPKRKKGNGRGMRIAGAGLMGVGVAGIGVGVAGLVIGGINQQKVDDPAVYGVEFDQYDFKGRRGNLLAGVGFGVGGAALAVGITLFIIGTKRGKSSGTAAPEDSSASARTRAFAIVPTGRGLAVAGRF